MVIFYDKTGGRLGKEYETGWNYSQKRNKEGSGKIELAKYPTGAKYASLYKGKEKIKDVVITNNSSNETRVNTNIKTLEILFKNYRIPENWKGWNKKPLSFVLADVIYGFDYIQKSTLNDFTQYLEKENIGLNKIKDGDIHLDYHEVGDSIHYYEQGHITFAFDCGEAVSQRYVRWVETIGEKVYIGIQSVSSNTPITNINDVDFSNTPVLNARRDIENDSSITGVPIASDKRYVAVRFVLKYINADWIQDFATHKVYNKNNKLVDRTVRGFTPVIRAFEIITRKKTEFRIKSVPTDMNELLEGIELSNITLWDTIQKIREKYKFDTNCYFENGKVYFEFAKSLIKNKTRQGKYLLRAGDKNTKDLNNTNIKELKQDIQKVNVLHCYGEGEKQQRLYVRIPETGTFDNMPTIEDTFTDGKIKTREELKLKGEKVLKEKRKEDNPIFEVETPISIRLFDKVSLVYPQSNTIYDVVVEEENISYKGNKLTQKFGIGGFLFNPLSALVPKNEDNTEQKILKPPIGLTIAGKMNAISLEWEGNDTDYVVRWKEYSQTVYNYRHTKQTQEVFERLNNETEYVFSVASVFEGLISEYTAEVKGKPVSDKMSFPADTDILGHVNFDDRPQEKPQADPSYTAWQSRIIEYDCTGKTEITMTFGEALNNVIILSGELKNDFTLKLFFDKQNGNGAKQYQIVYRLKGNHTVTIKTEIENKQKIVKPILAESYGSGCYAVVDIVGNVWHFRGEKGQGGGLTDLDVAGSLDDADYFVIEKENEIKKLEKPDGLLTIQKFDSPIGEIKTFFDGEYKHGFLEANGLPFSPDVFPEFKEYVKKNFNTGTEPITGWPLRPKLEGVMPGTKIFIKAAQGV